MKKSPIHSLLRREEGTALVEFTFSALFFFAFLLGVMQVCFVVFEYNTAAEAARETARWASVRGSACSAAGVVTDGTCPATLAMATTHVQSMPGAAQMTVTLQWCKPDGTSCAAATANAPGNLAQVTVSYSATSSWVPWVPGFKTLTLRSTAESVIWN